MLELLLQAAHLFQKIMDSLEPRGFIMRFQALLFQKVERFADVILSEKKIGELFEDFFGIRSFRRDWFPAVKVTIAYHMNNKKCQCESQALNIFSPTLTLIFFIG